MIVSWSAGTNCKRQYKVSFNHKRPFHILGHQKRDFLPVAESTSLHCKLSMWKPDQVGGTQRRLINEIVSNDKVSSSVETILQKNSAFQESKKIQGRI